METKYKPFWGWDEEELWNENNAYCRACEECRVCKETYLPKVWETEEEVCPHCVWSPEYAALLDAEDAAQG